ncbi:MAG: hypothetical protein NC548_06545 [Lachnospiraceae bacterium]|nr:hypothetical protein [Lachnospiraceae bacterium]
MSLAGKVITTKGDALLTRLVGTGRFLEITRVVFGSGSMPDSAIVSDMKGMSDVIEMIGHGTATNPEFKSNNIYTKLTYSNNMAGKIEADTKVTEFAIFVKDTDNTEILFAYCNLGDSGEPLEPYTGSNLITRNFDVSLVVGAIAGVKIAVDILTPGSSTDKTDSSISYIIDQVLNEMKSANIPANIGVTVFTKDDEGEISEGTYYSGCGII